MARSHKPERPANLHVASGLSVPGLRRALAAGVALSALVVGSAKPSAATVTTAARAVAPGPSQLPSPHLMRPAGNIDSVIQGPVVFHGGPVQTLPAVYVDFWDWTSDPSGEAAYLTRFLSSVGGSPWLNIVSQYGGGNPGGVLAGTWSDRSPVPAQPSDAQIQAEAAAAAAHFGLGTSFDDQIVVATPTGHSTPGFGSSFCAYHGEISAKPNLTYTDLPYLTDAGQACGQDLVNGANGLLDGVSIVEGHELAESITDPLLDAWYDSGSNEIADKCAFIGLADISTPQGVFAVQPLWSNAAGGCALSYIASGGPDLHLVKTLKTGSGHVEVHSATAASGYISAGQHSITRFSPADAGNGWWQMVGTTLYFVKTRNDGSGHVEIHSATAASGYQSGIDVATRLSPADAGNGWWQMVGTTLYFVKIVNDASGHIEVHSATAASGYRSGIDVAVPRFSPADAGNGWWQIADASGDLYFVKTINGGSGHVEVHSATAASGYRSGIDLATRLSPADAGNGWWQIAFSPLDLYFIKTKNDGSGTVEVHSATAASGYQGGINDTTWFSPSDAADGWSQVGDKG